MKGLFITSATNETFKYGESFVCLPGHEIKSLKYTNRTQPKKKGVAVDGLHDEEIFRQAVEYQPDLIVYIGSRWGELLSIPVLCRLNSEVARCVHICSDATDDPWWDLLIEYDKAGCFALQVAIDGNKHWPLADTQLTCLTPFDPARYPDPPVSHAEREIVCGYGGNFGGKADKRRLMLEQLLAFGLQTHKRSDHPESYQFFADFISRCRIIVNFPHTGTQQYMHVKGRVVETGLAGAVLLEQRGAPTADWFELGVDYLDYGTADEAREIVERLASVPDETQAMAERFRAKVLKNHSPQAFWSRIFDRIGLSSKALKAAA